MRKHFRVVLIIMPGMILAVMCWRVLAPSKLTYEGKTVGHYLDSLAMATMTGRSQVEADDPSVRAIYMIGPDAVPELQRAFRKRSSKYEKALEFLHRKLPSKFSRHLPPSKPQYLISLQEAACRCLAAIGPPAKRALPDLIKGFEDPLGRNMAFYAATEIGPQPENLTLLCSIVNKSTNDVARYYAAICISKTPKVNAAAVNCLARASADKLSFVRKGAIYALGELGTNARSASGILTSNLEDTNAAIRISSAIALWKVQGKTNLSVKWFAKALDDEINQGPAKSAIANSFGDHESNLLSLTRVLMEMGSQAKATLPLILKIADEEEIRLRMAGVEALWKIKNETNRIVSTCREALRHSDPNIRVSGAQFMTDFCISHGVLLQDFEEMLGRHDRFVRFYAARALWKLDSQTKTTIPFLVAGLNDHFTYYCNSDIRRLAAETLGEMGTEARSALPALQLALRDGQESVRLASAKSLRLINPVGSPVKLGEN